MPAISDVCSGCGLVVELHEDFVVAREFKAEPGFALHVKRHPPRDGVERRFHVGHFRGRIGERFYELTAQSDGSQPSQ
jgi:hypothetical protein